MSEFEFSALDFMMDYAVTFSEAKRMSELYMCEGMDADTAYEAVTGKSIA